jgi:serine/threonine-protein kinase
MLFVCSSSSRVDIAAAKQLNTAVAPASAILVEVIPNGAPPAVLGRYLLSGEIARGGMATVHFGRLRGAVGFSRLVAIKRMHPMLSKEPSFVAMFVDEARTAARIHHANVIPTLDVVSENDELCLVMEYVNGDSLATLLRRARAKEERIPVDIALAVAAGALHGLHAAHEATNERNEPLNVVHRDVSPHNILVGVDGVTRVFDFGVAKATGRLQTTSDGAVKGKCAYMAPEQLRDQPIDRRADVYALGIVLWEMLTGDPLFGAESAGASIMKAMSLEVPAPSTLRREVARDVDALVMKALERAVDRRFATASDMALAIEGSSIAPASTTRISQWMRAYAADRIEARNAAVAALEDASSVRPAQRPVTAGQAFVPTTTSIAVGAGAAAGAGASASESASGASASAATPSPPVPRARSGTKLVVGSVVFVVALVATAFGVHEARKTPASTPSNARRDQPEPSASTPAIGATAAPPASTAPPSVDDAPLSSTSPPASSPSPTPRPSSPPRRAAAPAHPPSRSAATAGSEDPYGLSH